MKVSFKSQPDNLEKHISQVMRENYKSMENDLINSCTQKVNDKYKDEFEYKLAKVENSPNKQDLITILSSLKDAYSQSGLNKDAESLDAQIKKLDIQV